MTSAENETTTTRSELSASRNLVDLLDEVGELKSDDFFDEIDDFDEPKEAGFFLSEVSLAEKVGGSKLSSIEAVSKMSGRGSVDLV